MKNNEMVSVPRELLERYVSSVEMHCYGFDGDDEIRALLDNPAEQHQGELVGMYKGEPVYASAEPSAPIERDERTEFEKAYQRAVESGWSNVKHLARLMWMTRASLTGFKPTVLTTCRLCDQLQTDLTERDDQNDKMRVLLQHLVYDYQAAIQAGYDKITALGGDCDSISKMLADNPNYQKAMALLVPDLESRPEERGTPETEPCSGCGTPGWTGACNKCIPY